MKSIKFCLIALILMAVVVSCQQDVRTTAVEEPVPAPKVSLQDIVTKELESGVINNDIFLDFAFGMKQSEVKNRVEKLVKQKKLKVKNGNVVYQLDINGELKDVLISPYYDNGKLYELGLTVEGGHYEDVSNIFLTKYAGCEIYRDTINDVNELYLIKGNRQIKVTSGNEVQVFYTDLSVQQRLGVKEGEKRVVKTKSNSDL